MRKDNIALINKYMLQNKHNDVDIEGDEIKAEYNDWDPIKKQCQLCCSGEDCCCC